MKAIITKYLPFTNTKPSRIKASAEGVKSITWTCNFLQGVAECKTSGEHKLAAHLFAASNQWPTNLASGGLPNGEWAHCFVPDYRNALEIAKVTIERLAKTDSAKGTLEIISQALKS